MAPFRNSYPTSLHKSAQDQLTTEDDGNEWKMKLEQSHNAMMSNAIQLVQKQKTVLSRLPSSLTLVELEKLERAIKEENGHECNSVTPTRALTKAISFFDKTIEKLQHHSDETLQNKEKEITALRYTVKDLDMHGGSILESSRRTPGQPSVQEALLHAKQAEEECSRWKKELREFEQIMISNTLELIQKQKTLLAPLSSNLITIELENLERKTVENEIPAAVAFTTAASYLDHIIDKFHSSHDGAMKKMTEEARVLYQRVEELEAKISELNSGKGDIFKTLDVVEQCLTSIEKGNPKILEHFAEGMPPNVRVVDRIVPRLNAIQSYMQTIREGNNSQSPLHGKALSIKSRIAVFDQKRDDGSGRSFDTKIVQLEKTNEQLRAKLQEQENHVENDKGTLRKYQQEALRNDADIRRLEKLCETLRRQLSALEAEGSKSVLAATARHQEERRILEREIKSLTNQLRTEQSQSAIQKAALEDAKVLIEELSIARAKLAERIDTLEDELGQSVGKSLEPTGKNSEREGTDGSTNESEDLAYAWKLEKEQMEADHDRRVRNLKTLVEEVEAQRDRLRAERDELRMSRSGRHWVDQVEHLEAERDRLVGDLRTSLVEVEAERDQLRKERDELRAGSGGTVHHQESTSALNGIMRHHLINLAPSSSSDSCDSGGSHSSVDAKEMQALHGKFAEKAYKQARLIASLQEENDIKDAKLQNLQSMVDRLLEERGESSGRFSSWRKSLAGKVKREKLSAADADMVTEDEEREGR